MPVVFVPRTYVNKVWGSATQHRIVVATAWLAVFAAVAAALALWVWNAPRVVTAVALHCQLLALKYKVGVFGDPHKIQQSVSMAVVVESLAHPFEWASGHAELEMAPAAG